MGSPSEEVAAGRMGEPEVVLTPPAKVSAILDQAGYSSLQRLLHTSSTPHPHQLHSLPASADLSGNTAGIHLIPFIIL